MRAIPLPLYERIKYHLDGAERALEGQDKKMYKINVELVEELTKNNRFCLDNKQKEYIRNKISDLSKRVRKVWGKVTQTSA